MLWPNITFTVQMESQILTYWLSLRLWNYQNRQNTTYSYPHHKGEESCLMTAITDVKDSHNACIWYLYNSIYLVHSTYLSLESEEVKQLIPKHSISYEFCMTDIQLADVFIPNMESCKALMKEQRCKTLHKRKGQCVNMNMYEPDRDLAISSCSRSRLMLFSWDPR